MEQTEGIFQSRGLYFYQQWNSNGGGGGNLLHDLFLGSGAEIVHAQHLVGARGLKNLKN